MNNVEVKKLQRKLSTLVTKNTEKYYKYHEN